MFCISKRVPLFVDLPYHGRSAIVTPCKTVENDSSTTHFSVGVTFVSVTVNSGVISTQSRANEFAAVNDKNKRNIAIGVFIFVL
jgi:hypothetical protein